MIVLPRTWQATKYEFSLTPAVPPNTAITPPPGTYPNSTSTVLFILALESLTCHCCLQRNKTWHIGIHKFQH